MTDDLNVVDGFDKLEPVTLPATYLIHPITGDSVIEYLFPAELREWLDKGYIAVTVKDLWDFREKQYVINQRRLKKTMLQRLRRQQGPAPSRVKKSKKPVKPKVFTADDLDPNGPKPSR